MYYEHMDIIRKATSEFAAKLASAIGMRVEQIDVSMKVFETEVSIFVKLRGHGGMTIKVDDGKQND